MQYVLLFSALWIPYQLLLMIKSLQICKKGILLEFWRTKKTEVHVGSVIVKIKKYVLSRRLKLAIKHEYGLDLAHLCGSLFFFFLSFKYIFALYAKLNFFFLEMFLWKFASHVTNKQISWIKIFWLFSYTLTLFNKYAYLSCKYVAEWHNKVAN